MPPALSRDVARFLERVGRRGAEPADAAVRDRLLAEVAAAQAEANEPFGRLVRARGGRFDAGPDGWPALPTDVFRYARVATFPPEADLRTFTTSGTTTEARGQHPFADLSLYDLAARTAAEALLFPGGRPRSLVMLAPPPDEAPGSSLSYMLGRFVEWFAEEVHWTLTDGRPDPARLALAIRSARAPIAVLGTSFALAALDEMIPEGEVLALGQGALVMQTGGFKGRTREIDPDEMRARLAARFGVPPDVIVAEYGMTELSSQLYTPPGSLHEGREAYVAPAWVRAQPVDPLSLRPVPPGETGILRIDDLANVGSVVSIQTADLAKVLPDGRVVLYGRAPGATPRGCSLAIEEALAGRPS